MTDLTQRLDSLAAGLSPHEGARLTFHDRCAAFALLKRGFPQSLVAKTFGVSQSAVSTLAACETNLRRYRDIAAEFRLLGFEAFRDKYLTSEILDRLARFRADDARPGDKLRGRAFNPKAIKYLGVHDVMGQPMRVAILAKAPKPGFYFSPCNPDGTAPEQGFQWGGHDNLPPDSDSCEPFWSSAEAFDGAWKANGYDSPRPRPGRRT